MRAPALTIVLLYALLAMGLGPAAEAAAPPPQRGRALNTPELIDAARQRGEISVETSNLYLAYALVAPENLPEDYRSQVPWDGTFPLLELQSAADAMAPGPARAEIEALLAETCADSGSPLPLSDYTSYFYIQYGTISGGLTIGDYAHALDGAWSTEVAAFGWAAPPILPATPSGLYHVRIDALGYGLYGYVSPTGTYAGNVGDNPNTTWVEPDAYATCMVLSSDYSPFPGEPWQAMQATVAHEFNHSIQFGYGAITGSNAPDASFSEASATWMEDEVFDAANDNYFYLWPSFSTCMGEYNPAVPHSVYDYWLTFRGLTEPHGTGIAGGGEQVLQAFWELTSKSTTSNMLPALNAALLSSGTNLANAYHAYAIAAKFNKTCAGAYVSPYCFEEGAAYVAAAGSTAVHGAVPGVGGSYIGSLADNHSLNWIGLPTGSLPYRVTLTNTATGGQLRGSVVCDTGTALVVTPFPAVAGAGSSTSVAAYSPSGCNSVVAVLTNEAQTEDDPSSCTERPYRIATSSVIIAGHKLFVPLVLGAEATATGQIANGDFELGSVYWLESSTNGWPLIVTGTDLSVDAHSGTWAAWLGGDMQETSSIEQEVTVPGGTPALAYWHWISSYDACGYDVARVRINGVVVSQYDLCQSNNTGGWVPRTVSLAPYAGQRVRLRIEAQTGASTSSSLRVDDVTFQ